MFYIDIYLKIIKLFTTSNKKLRENIMAKKETPFEKIQRLISSQDTIRNIATSAHIHHGKTALTDNLLAAAGMMSEKLAGDLEGGMATWQHSDEQERLLTVDAANVSMAHELEGKEYLVNLIIAEYSKSIK